MHYIGSQRPSYALKYSFYSSRNGDTEFDSCPTLQRVKKHLHAAIFELYRIAMTFSWKSWINFSLLLEVSVNVYKLKKPLYILPLHRGTYCQPICLGSHWRRFRGKSDISALGGIWPDEHLHWTSHSNTGSFLQAALIVLDPWTGSGCDTDTIWFILLITNSFYMFLLTSLWAICAYFWVSCNLCCAETKLPYWDT